VSVGGSIVMRRTTLGILAGVIGSAIGAAWWKRRTASRKRSVVTVTTAEVLVEYDRLGEGIV
jgi:hypothetical protein